MLNDYRSAEIEPEKKVLFAFLEKVVQQSNRICQADVDRVRDAGWSEEAIYDAITVCALFRFYNTWIDATGVQGMPDFAYAMSGQRLATSGYVADTPDTPSTEGSPCEHMNTVTL